MLSCPEYGKIAERKSKIEYEDKLLKADCAIPPLMKFILEIMVPDLFMSEVLLTAHSSAQVSLRELEPFFA